MTLNKFKDISITGVATAFTGGLFLQLAFLVFAFSRKNAGKFFSEFSNIVILINIFITIVILLVYFFDRNKRDENWRILRDDIGLDDFVSKLEGSPYHPDQALHEVNTSLDFLGHGGSKWSLRNEEILDKAIEKVKLCGGRVRFILYNPLEGEYGTPDLKSEDEEKITKSLMCLFRLMDKHNNINEREKTLSVYLYSRKPSFRLAFINREQVFVGHYRDYTRNSKDSPILVFSKGTDNWGYYAVYHQYFRDLLNNSVNATDLRDRIESIAKNRKWQ